MTFHRASAVPETVGATRHVGVSNVWDRICEPPGRLVLTLATIESSSIRGAMLRPAGQARPEYLGAGRVTALSGECVLRGVNGPDESMADHTADT